MCICRVRTFIVTTNSRLTGILKNHEQKETPILRDQHLINKTSTKSHWKQNPSYCRNTLMLKNKKKDAKKHRNIHSHNNSHAQATAENNSQETTHISRSTTSTFHPGSIFQITPITLSPHSRIKITIQPSKSTSHRSSRCPNVPHPTNALTLQPLHSPHLWAAPPASSKRTLTFRLQVGTASTRSAGPMFANWCRYKPVRSATDSSYK